MSGFYRGATIIPVYRPALQHSLAPRTNFGLEADEHCKLSLDKIYFVKILFMKYRDNILLYRNNAGKYRITCDYPISPSSSAMATQP